MSGSKRVHVVIAGWVCDGVVVVSAAEWAGLGGDPKQQQAFMTQRMQLATSNKQRTEGMLTVCLSESLSFMHADVCQLARLKYSSGRGMCLV